MNINHIRQEYRRLRRNLSPHQQQNHAVLLCDQLHHMFAFSRGLRIAAYLAVQGEISLNPWIAANRHQRIYLPKLHETIDPRLRFAPLTPNTQWISNRFGIIEPASHWGRALHPRMLDIILLPLVAFDRAGYRLGMGGGYYDRSLAFRHYRRHWMKPRLIGVAHSCQEHAALPRQPWDVPLDCIVTEREMIVPSRQDVLFEE